MFIPRICVTLLHYSGLLWLVIFKYVCKSILLGCFNWLFMIMAKVIRRTFFTDKWNNFASYGSPNLVMRFYVSILTRKISNILLFIAQPMELKDVSVEFLTGGVELLWGKCTIFPDLGTRDTDRWRINLHLCATCQYPLNRNWKNCAFAPK